MKKENPEDRLLRQFFQNQRKKDERSTPSFSIMIQKTQNEQFKMKKIKWLFVGILTVSILAIGLYSKSKKSANSSVNYEVAKASFGFYETIMKDGKVIINDIQFDYDNAAIRPASMPIIHKIADMLKKHKDLKLSIEGHTDSDGSSNYNMVLSEVRAQAVKEALLNLGISEARLQTKGFGEEKPMVPNDTSGGKAKNRRVELVRI